VNFIALFPQSFSGGWDAQSDDGVLAMKVLDRIEHQYKISLDRIYLTGLSSGGSGVWSLAAKYPDKWAAIVPLGGSADPKTAPTIKHIPCWCFHGTLDTSVRVDNPRNMINALLDAGGRPIYTEFPDRGHDVWLKPYHNPKLFDWLLAQRKPTGSSG
jgi:predicted peptidase